MEILSAAMAFAVLMIVFSTAVTGLTETYLRFTARRPWILAKSLERYLKNDKTVQRFIKSHVKELPPEEFDKLTDEQKEAYANEATKRDSKKKTVLHETREALSLNLSHSQAKSDEPDKHNTFVMGRNRVDTLTVYSFLQRLAGTDLGQTIASEANGYAIRGLSIGFERYIAASNEVFRKHAQYVTVVLSVLFAIAVNIDAIRLFQYLVDNPVVSAQISEQVDDVKAANETALTKLDAALTELQSVDGARPLDAGETDPIDDLKKDVSEVKASLQGVIQEFDLPIGYDQYPYAKFAWFCQESPDTDVKCRTDGNLIRWLIGTVVAGFLIGLGGPFWYKVFAGLSRVAQVLRLLRGGSINKEAIENEEGSEPNQPASQQLIKALGSPQSGVELVKLFKTFAGEKVDDDPAEAGPKDEQGKPEAQTDPDVAATSPA